MVLFLFAFLFFENKPLSKTEWNEGKSCFFLFISFGHVALCSYCRVPLTIWVDDLDSNRKLTIQAKVTRRKYIKDSRKATVFFITANAHLWSLSPHVVLLTSSLVKTWKGPDTFVFCFPELLLWCEILMPEPPSAPLLSGSKWVEL